MVVKPVFEISCGGFYANVLFIVELVRRDLYFVNDVWGLSIFHLEGSCFCFCNCSSLQSLSVLLKTFVLQLFIADFIFCMQL